MSSTVVPVLRFPTAFTARPTFTNFPPNPPPDPPMTSPSVYLYGFLAALILIFFVAICVALRGYRTRRILRARIDDAIARGVLVPGYDPENPTLPFVQTAGSRGRIVHVMNRPVMFEEWIGGEGEGILKPTSLDALRPYDPPAPLPPLQPTPQHRTPPFSQLLELLGEYRLVSPRSGTDPAQLQGRPGRRGMREGWVGTLGGGQLDALDTSEDGQGEKEEKSLDGVREVRAGVLIAMPDRTHPHWGRSSGPGGYAAVQSPSRPSSWQSPHGAVASSSRPTSFSAVHPGHRPSTSIRTAATLVVQEEEGREFPELVLGIVGFGVEEVRDANAGEEVIETGEEKEGVEGGKGKEVGRTQPGVIPL